MTNKTLGEFIKSRRLVLNITQRALARQIGLKTPSHLCDVENGFRQLGTEYLPALAETLEVSMEELQEHDPRAPLEAARELFDKHPEYIRALHRVVRAAPKLSAGEMIRRIEKEPPATGAMTPATKQPGVGEA